MLPLRVALTIQLSLTLLLTKPRSVYISIPVCKYYCSLLSFLYQTIKLLPAVQEIAVNCFLGWVIIIGIVGGLLLLLLILLILTMVCNYSIAQHSILLFLLHSLSLASLVTISTTCDSRNRTSNSDRSKQILTAMACLTIIRLCSCQLLAPYLHKVSLTLIIILDSDYCFPIGAFATSQLEKEVCIHS